MRGDRHEGVSGAAQEALEAACDAPNDAPAPCWAAPSNEVVGPLGLRHERGCIESRLWRCDVAPGLAPEVLVTRLVEAWGWRHVRASMGSVELRDAQGHAVIWVPRTGRLQLRIDYAIPKELRPRAAQVVAMVLERALGEVA